MGDSESTLSVVTARYHRRVKWLRRLGVVLAVVSVVPSLVALWVDGHLPASVPPGKRSYSSSALAEAYRRIDARNGTVDMNLLSNDLAALNRYVEQLASVSPLNVPEAFPQPADKLAFWLNAYHALVLQQMVEAWPGARDIGHLSFYRRTWPVGGSRLTLFAIERRFLAPAEDPRVFLALFTGARGSGVLDGAPFDPATLDAQLNDAVRRFVRRKDNFSIAGKTVRLAEVFHEHRDELLAAAPLERKQILQIVWAFLPDDCQGNRPGCDTRGDLDRACGPELDQCQVEYAPLDRSFAVRVGN